MITKLTPAQEAILNQVREEWLAHGLSTQLANRPQAEAGVRAAYKAAGLKPPRFMIWLGSPMAGVMGQALLPDILAELDDSQVYSQVYSQVGLQVDSQVYSQVDSQVHSQVDSQVDSQVHSQVGLQVYSQVDSQVRSQVDSQVYSQVDSQVYSQVDSQVYSQVDSQVRSQVDSQVGLQVDSQVYSQVHSQVRSQVDSQVHSQVRSQVDSQVYSQVHSQVHSQVGLQVHSQVDSQVRSQVDSHVRSLMSLYYRGLISGQHWAGYYSYFDAMERIGVTGLDPIHGQQQVAQNCGWWWCFENAAILTERPNLLRHDPQGRLHCADGPAIGYPDGWGGYYWHGTWVPDDLILSGWDFTRIMAEPNTEIRRCAIERSGWDQFTDRLSLVAECADPGNDGQTIALYDLPQDFALFEQPARILLCTNGTIERDGTRRRFGLPVPVHHNDPIAAAADLYGWPVAAYKALEVRR